MEDLTTNVAANVIIEIFKESVKGVKGLSEFISSEAKSRDILGTAAKTYKAQMHSRYNYMRIFGMAKPIPLTKIYVRLNVLQNITAHQRISVDDLEDLYTIGQRRFGLVSDTKPGIEVVNTIDRFVLLGKPGSGKTTFLKCVTLQALEGGLGQNYVPIFISLNDLSHTEQDTLTYIIHQFDICGLSNHHDFVKNLLKRGACILLFDGLDEVVEPRRTQIIRDITTLSKKYGENKFIVSCRIAAYTHWFGKFSDVEIADFEDPEIETFINNWFTSDEVKGDLCWKTLCNNPSIKELATTPLLLTMLCLAYEETMDLSTNRAELYEDAIDALLRRWDISRTIVRDEIYRNLTTKKKEELLSVIAARTFERMECFFPEKRLENIVFAFIRHLPGTTEGDAIDAAPAVIKSIEAQHGVLVERAKGVHSFSHLTFQEYFRASYIVAAGWKSQKNLVQKYLADPRWREVIILVANLLPQADRFILEILEKATDLGFSEKYLLELRKKAEKWGGRGRRTIEFSC
jgi:predicted NACHT family NTPase